MMNNLNLVLTNSAKNTSRAFSNFLLEKQRNNPVDKLQGSFLKRILSVH